MLFCLKNCFFINSILVSVCSSYGSYSYGAISSCHQSSEKLDRTKQRDARTPKTAICLFFARFDERTKYVRIESSRQKDH